MARRLVTAPAGVARLGAGWAGRLNRGGAVPACLLIVRDASFTHRYGVILVQWEYIMTQAAIPLHEFIRRLPQDIQAEVRDFAEYLLQKRKEGSARLPDLSWRGALPRQSDSETSVDLQHHGLDWWGG